jgi:hypothetical protein
MIDHNNLYNSLFVEHHFKIMLISMHVLTIFSKNYIIYENSLLNLISSKVILRKIDDNNLVFQLGTLVLLVCCSNVRYRIFNYFFAEL